MRNLARPLLRLLGRDDRGAIGVLIAVLLAGGVLLGMGALTIDVGQIYQNRAELQNGADAAALAIATQCADGTCPANPLTTAVTYASDNASALTQDVAGVDCVYGLSGGTAFSDGSCPTGFNTGSGLTTCPKDPSGNFVDVQTETGTVSTLLPPVFAQTLVGRATYDGTTVKACAQAAWSAVSGIAFTMSECEFTTAVASTDGYWPSYSATNPSTWPTSSHDSAYDQSLTLHDPQGGSASCPDGSAGQDAPGAFGWTADPLNTCYTPIVDNTYGAQTGRPAKGDCKTVLPQLCNQTDTKQGCQASGQMVLVPVYSDVTGQGNNTTYTLAGFASFVITGFNLNSIKGGGDWLNSGLLCTSSSVDCIDGFFTSNQMLPPGSLGTGGPPRLTG
jgi:Flp pilus assembly protein TadG